MVWGGASCVATLARAVHGPGAPLRGHLVEGRVRGLVRVGEDEHLRATAALRTSPQVDPNGLWAERAEALKFGETVA